MLDFGYTDIDDQHASLLSVLGRLSRLGPSEITDATLTALAPLKSLTYLDIWGTKISNNGLKQIYQFPRLQELDLSDTAVSDEGIQHLHSMKSAATPMM